MKHDFSKRPHMNLVQSIRAAQSLEEIAQLMEVGKSFTHASAKTRSRWHETFKRRIIELEAGIEC